MNRAQASGAVRIESFLVAASAAFLLGGVLIVGANVAARYVFHETLAWSAEAARYAIVWSAFLGSCVLVRRRQHLTVSMRAGGGNNRPSELIVLFGSAVFFAILTVSGAVLVWNTAGQTASSIAFLPMPAVYSVMPISAFDMWATTTAQLARTLQADRDGPDRDGPDRDREEAP